jgi:hypothetical protein
MSASLSEIDANRRNALKSTGPRTAAGKYKSSLNALRHGLTAQTVVLLPHEDRAAYDALRAGLLDEFDPHTPLESQIVLTILDTQWRLNRARTLEAVILSEASDASDLELADAINKFSLHEARLTRILHTSLKQLRELQTTREKRNPQVIEVRWVEERKRPDGFVSPDHTRPSPAPAGNPQNTPPDPDPTLPQTRKETDLPRNS